MPPLGGKGKKGKEGRQSRSRNTTPSSVASASASVMSAHTAYLDIAISNFTIPNNVLYDDILERHGGSGGIPDPQHLETLANELKTLSQLAEARQNACDGGMRKLSERRKERIEEERVLDQANREAEEKASLKRAAEDEELDRERKGEKMKKRKERSTIREERPLTHGAHGIARQDGQTSSVRGEFASLTPPSLFIIATTLDRLLCSSILLLASVLFCPACGLFIIVRGDQDRGPLVLIYYTMDVHQILFRTSSSR